MVYETRMIGRRAGLTVFFRSTSRVMGATSPRQSDGLLLAVYSRTVSAGFVTG